MARTSTFQDTIIVTADDGTITRHHCAKETYTPCPTHMEPVRLRVSGEDGHFNRLEVPDSPAASRVTIVPPVGSAVTKFLSWSDDEEDDDTDATFEVASDQAMTFGIPAGKTLLHIHVSAAETLWVLWN